MQSQIRIDRSIFEDIYENKLTPIQKQTLPYVLEGLSNKEIARRLEIIVPSTISHRINSIRKKFDAFDKKDLIWLFNQFRPDLVSDRGRESGGIERIYEILYPECSEALDSPFYLDRQDADRICQEIIERQGCLLKIKGSKQMGKTSLVNRLVDWAVKQDDYVVY